MSGDLGPSGYYLDQMHRVGSLVADLDDTALALPVPGCPLWAVRDVVAHLAALPHDLLGGLADGAGEPEWTARQVAERRGVAIPELLAEWAEWGPRLAPQLDGWGFAGWRPFYDAAVHEDDIREALGRPLAEGRGQQVMLTGLLEGARRRLVKADLPALTVEAGAARWVLGDVPVAPGQGPSGQGPPANCVDAGSVGELGRMLSGRRSLTAMRARSWTGDPEPYLPLLPVFSPPA